MNHRANTSPASFYPSHLAQHVQLPRPLPMDHHIHTAPSLPSILMPGGGPRRQNNTLATLDSSLFFHNLPVSTPPVAPAMPVSYVSPIPVAPVSILESEPTPFVPPIPPSRSQQSSPLPLPLPLPQHERPHIPPKPFVQQVSAAPLAEQSSSSQNAVSPTSDEDEELARVLKLSLQETGPSISQESEEEVLARVLKESLAMAPTGSMTTNNVDRKGKQPVRSIDPPSMNTQETALRNEELRQKQLREDEEFARALEREESVIASEHPSRNSSLQRSQSTPQPVVNNDSRPGNVGPPPLPKPPNSPPPPFEQSHVPINLYPHHINHAFTAPVVPQVHPSVNHESRPPTAQARPHLGRSASAQAQIPSYPAVAPLKYEPRPVTPLDALRNGDEMQYGAGASGMID